MPTSNTHPSEQPAYQEAQPATEDDYRKKYGDALNQMGEWRRSAQEKDAQLAALTQQMAEITNRLAAQPPSYQPPPQPVTPQRLFPHKQPDELLNYGELEDILARDILPTIVDRLQATAFQAKDGAAAEAQRMLPTWDISAQEEAAALGVLRREYVNFDNRFSLVERNKAIRTQVYLQRQSNSNPAIARPPVATAVGVVGGNGAPPAGPVMIDPSRLVRRQTFVESAAPAQTATEPLQTVSVEQKIRQEIAALDAKARSEGKPRSTAAQYGEVLAKYGVKAVNDWPGANSGGGETILNR